MDKIDIFSDKNDITNDNCEEKIQLLTSEMNQAKDNYEDIHTERLLTLMKLSFLIPVEILLIMITSNIASISWSIAIFFGLANVSFAKRIICLRKDEKKLKEKYSRLQKEIDHLKEKALDGIDKRVVDTLLLKQTEIEQLYKADIIQLKLSKNKGKEWHPKFTKNSIDAINEIDKKAQRIRYGQDDLGDTI